MSKSVDEVAAKRIVFETTVPVDEVLARFDEELSKDRAGPKLLELLKNVKTREELEQGIQNISGGKDFVLFASSPFHNWRNAYHGTTQTPKTVQYTFGNPLVAETMIRHDTFAALHVPPRMLVAEKSDHTGTQVIYMLPSSVIAVSSGGNVSGDLKAAAEALDEKVERLVRRVTSTRKRLSSL